MRNPLISHFHIGQELTYWRKGDTAPENVKYMYQKGRNTVIVEKDGRRLLVHLDQVKPAIKETNGETSEDLKEKENEDDESDGENGSTTEDEDDSILSDATEPCEMSYNATRVPNSVRRQPMRNCQVPRRFTDFDLSTI